MRLIAKKTCEPNKKGSHVFNHIYKKTIYTQKYPMEFVCFGSPLLQITLLRRIIDFLLTTYFQPNKI